MKLTMRLRERSYDIILKRGALGWVGQLAHLDRRVLVVTDSGVPAQYAQQVCAQCSEGRVVTVPQGEASKSLAVYAKVQKAALDPALLASPFITTIVDACSITIYFSLATWMFGL